MGLIEDAVEAQQAALKRRTNASRKPGAGETFAPSHPQLSSVRQIELDKAHAFEHRLICEAQDRSAVGAYKMLRTQISQRLKSQGWSTIGVTACKGGEGKTLTSINLAMSLASQGNRNVFLVDLDLRRHSMAEYLGIDDAFGLMGALEGQSLSEALVRVGDSNLYALLNDKTTENSSEMLSSEQMKNLTTRLRKHDGIVIFDLPPILRTDDYLAFSPEIDCTLFVVSEQQTLKDDLRAASDQLDPQRLLAVVLNKSRWSDVSEFYYY